MSIKRTVDPRFKCDGEYAILGGMLAQDHAWECHAKAQP